MVSNGSSFQSRSVDFGRNPEMTVKNLMTVVLNCHRLEELKVSKLSSETVLKQLTDEDASFMVSKLCQTLKTLCFNTTNLSNATFEASPTVKGPRIRT